MPVTLTDAAVERVVQMSQDKAANWLRLSVRGGGCTGLNYVLDWVEAPTEGDKIYEFGNARVCVDKKSYLFLNGIELDYQADLISQAFVFNNPLAKRSCSCGESFAV